MLASAGARSPLFHLAVTAGIVLIFIFGFLAWQSPAKIPFTHGTTHVEMIMGTGKTAPSVSVSEVIRLMYQHMKVAPDAPAIDDGNGTQLTLPPNPRYTRKMGKDVLILDLDTRPLASTKAFEKGEYEWSKINHVSGGVFGHYTYAQIHGYDYKFIHAKDFSDRHATWIKPSAFANQIKDYKFILFLDADATIRWYHLPVEWMLNYWNIEPQHSLTMALDPWDPSEPQYNSDRFNRTYTNTGFVLVQNNPKTMEILKAWHECPEDTRYKNCSQWKQPKFHEQSAFGEYIRYDYEDYVKELPCAEANGFPGVSVSNCQGKFIRHYWFEKSLVKKDFSENIMQAFSLPIQRSFAENTGGVVVQTDKNEII